MEVIQPANAAGGAGWAGTGTGCWPTEVKDTKNQNVFISKKKEIENKNRCSLPHKLAAPVFQLKN